MEFEILFMLQETAQLNCREIEAKDSIISQSSINPVKPKSLKTLTSKKKQAILHFFYNNGHITICFNTNMQSSPSMSAFIERNLSRMLCPIGVRSGEPGGQLIAPPLPIQRFCKVSFKNS